MKFVRKRDGRLEQFDQDRITNAVWKAAKAVGGKDRERARKRTRLGSCRRAFKSAREVGE